MVAFTKRICFIQILGSLGLEFLLAYIMLRAPMTCNLSCCMISGISCYSIMHFVLIFLMSSTGVHITCEASLAFFPSMQHSAHDDQEFPKRLTCLDATSLPCVPSSFVAFMLQKGIDFTNGID